MGFWDDVLGGAIKGYSTSKPVQDRERKWKFDELDHTEMLFSSQYLNELYEDARTKSEHEAILGHLYKHDVTDIDTYKQIEQKIIDKFY